MTKYLATDLDGTLIFPKLKYSFVCKQNKDTIKLFKNNVIIVSGRNQPFIKKVCKEIGVPQTFVAANGASVYYNGKELFSYTLEKKNINKIIDYVQNNYKDYSIVIFDKNGKLFSLSDNVNSTIETEAYYRKNYPKTSYTTNKNINTIKKLLSKENSIIKVNIDTNPINKEKIYNYLLSQNFNFSYAPSSHCLEITALEANKGHSLLRLTEHMKINNNSVYVIGDDLNDVPMFELYKNSFLVSNDKNKSIHNKASHVLQKFTDLKEFIKEE